MKRKLFVLAVAIGLVLGNSVYLPERAEAQAGDPILVGAGDIANCSRTEDEATAKLLDNIAGTVFTLGDNVYPDGTATQFSTCYGPTWGRHKSRTKPSVGNHDYHVTGAAGYYGYFGSAASPLDNNCSSNCKGYYSYNLGAWHIIVLNSEIDRTTGSPQDVWLRADLAANSNVCTLAYWHKPRFSSALHGNSTSVQAFWNALYQYGADVVVNGHDHTYERFAPQNPSGQADSTKGIREFVVGTGGATLYGFQTIQPNSQVRNNTTWGVLKLTLHSTSYDWQFVPIAGQTFTDSGSANCVGGGTVPTPTRTPTPGGPTATRTPTASRTPTPSSSDVIFSDSFESGDFSAWSASSTDAGDLSVTSAAALIGSRGMQARIDDTNTISVTDETPNAERRYRVRFYFDPNSITMASGNNHFILKGFMGTSPEVAQVEFRQSSGAYQLRSGLINDGSTWSYTNWFTISDAAHFVELDWRAATGTGQNNGGLTMWLDGAQVADLTGIDNDTRRVDRARLGSLGGIDSGTSGTYYFDAFESRRQTYIGPAGGSPPPTLTPGGPTPTRTPTTASTPMHIGDLDGASNRQSGQWTAIVTITVHDSSHNPVANATVSGAWSNGASGTSSCTTNSSGECTVNKTGIGNGTSSVTFTVNSVSRSGFSYISGSNHDPDGSSNGTRIVVPKQ